MKKALLIAAGLAVAIPMLSIAMEADAAGADRQRTERGQLVRAIVMKWGNHVQEAYRTDPRRWAVDMVPIFSGASIDTLKRAAQAKTFNGMNDAFLVEHGSDSHLGLFNAMNSGALKTPGKVLGDPASDLVFVPVTPCRIIDTRVAGGAIAANTARGFDVTAVSSYTFQGGDASNCNVGASGSFAAAVINFTVVTPSAAGYITAFPFGASQPVAATVNYTAGDIRGNLATVKLDQGASANELSVYTFAQTHLVADIVGYFIAPETNLDCNEKLSAGVTIAAGSFGTQSTAACDAGYTITGGGCSMSNFDGRVVTTRTIPSSQTHFCAFRNEGGTTVDGLAYARCCRN